MTSCWPIRSSAIELAAGGRRTTAFALPRDLFGTERANSMGIDLSNEYRLAELSAAMAAAPAGRSRPAPIVDEACRRRAAVAGDRHRSARPASRAYRRRAGGAALELIPTIVREAGKTYANAVGEVREAADFLRYYAAQSRAMEQRYAPAAGVFACISPWNFPLAIFTGQVAGALAAGNGVVAKPAEETPDRGAQAVGLFRAAGLPAEVLQLADRRRRVGARLVANPAINGVVFTGSTETARSINQALAARRADRAVHRRDRRTERDDRRLPGAARAAGRRRADLGLRFGRPALLGAARALRCRRTSPTASCRC